MKINSAETIRQITEAWARIDLNESLDSIEKEKLKQAVRLTIESDARQERFRATLIPVLISVPITLVTLLIMLLILQMRL